MEDFLLLAFIFLVAGTLSVPIASRLGLGSVLGYLIAGIAISPLLVAIDVDVGAVQHFAEFGVVMMLFLIGLELEPRLLWQMRNRLIGLGGMQVSLTIGLVAAIGIGFGLAWQSALAVGCVLALSSTAIVLQTLGEKGLLRSDGGQASFQVLLFEDIAVIPILALLPLLAMLELAALGSHAADAAHGGEGGHGGGISLVDGQPGWLQALITLGAVGFVVVCGHYLTRPTFRFIAGARLRELFVANALLWVIGIALLMTAVGMSPALGTFLAGVVLANSEYRHQLQSDIDPFKGLLLGLFFITVGASINFELLAESWASTLALTVGVIALKAAVLYLIAVLFRITGSDRWLFTLGLAQGGEFGFVLLSVSVAQNVIPQTLSDQMLLVVALSMLFTPVLFIIFDRLIAPRYAAEQSREADAIEHESAIIIAGHGRWGGVINRILRSAGHEPVVLDYSSAQLDMLRTFGFRVFFGDATRPDLLHAAGIEQARMLVIAIDDRDQITELTRYVRQTYPDVHVIARAKDRNHVYELYAAGCRDIIRETFDSGVRAGRSALEALGVHPHEAELQVRDFVAEDRQALVQLAEVYRAGVPIQENPEYVARARKLMEEADARLRGERSAFSNRGASAWSPPSMGDVDAARKRDGGAS